MTADLLSLLDDCIGRALKAGADAADALAYDSQSVNVARRLNQPERLERSESRDLGLRVLIGKRQAMVSTSERTPEALAALVERAVTMARAVPEDPYCGLADTDQIAKSWPDLDLADPAEPSVDQLIALATETEQAALAVPGVTNSEGAEASWGRSDIALVASNGFAGAYGVTHFSLSAAVLAGTGTGMERDYDYTSAGHAADLRPAAEVGRSAGERAVRRLNPRKGATATLPVVFDWRVSSGLLGSLSGAISGPSIARGTSFLRDKLGEEIFGPGIEIVDDPHLVRGHRSRPFDGEGVAPAKRAIVENGRLTTWLLDLRSARQLGLKTTGHASRGTGGPPAPSPSNLALMPGPKSPEALIGEIESGLYVTELMGMGVNGVTGDYSRGAAGYWIEKGKLAYPVSEMTIASNLKDMYKALTPANDLVRRYGVDAPTLRIDGMMIAGR
ncbi:MAG TPA: TldD/PmbA family protein [Alphaproteobacteria bacterium]|nr:TldD/PmbA family protein [Alphaproteobacteria bacterium]